MPNWCSNTLLVSGPRAEVERFAAAVADPDLSFGDGGHGTALSLNTLIAVTDDDSSEIVSRRFLEWGTKWDIEAEVLGQHDLPGEQLLLRYDFESAGSPPTRALNAASQAHPKLSLLLAFKDEAVDAFDVIGWRAGAEQIEWPLETPGTTSVLVCVDDVPQLVIRMFAWQDNCTPVTGAPAEAVLAELRGTAEYRPHVTLVLWSADGNPLGEQTRALLEDPELPEQLSWECQDDYEAPVSALFSLTREELARVAVTSAAAEEWFSADGDTWTALASWLPQLLVDNADELAALDPQRLLGYALAVCTDSEPEQALEVAQQLLDGGIDPAEAVRVTNGLRRDIGTSLEDAVIGVTGVLAQPSGVS